MLKKRFYILLFFCLLLGGNVNSSTVDKGDNNAPFENKRTETDYLPIADPFVMLYNNKYYALWHRRYSERRICLFFF